MILFYSGGCKFCRWVARTIVPLIDPNKHMDVIPFRHPYAANILQELNHMDWDTITAHWWFLDLDGKLWAGNKGGGQKLLMSHGNGWWARLIPSSWFDWADDWVKAHRPFLSQWVKDGPAPLVWNGVATTTEEGVAV